MSEYPEIRKGHLFRMVQIMEIVSEEGITAGDVSRILYNTMNDNRFMAAIPESGSIAFFMFRLLTQQRIISVNQRY